MYMYTCWIQNSNRFGQIYRMVSHKNLCFLSGIAPRTEKSADDDGEGWNGNHDSDDDNIVVNNDKDDQKTYKYHQFWVKLFDF